jgi:hypothetical protein
MTNRPPKVLLAATPNWPLKIVIPPSTTRAKPAKNIPAENSLTKKSMSAFMVFFHNQIQMKQIVVMNKGLDIGGVTIGTAGS